MPDSVIGEIWRSLDDFHFDIIRLAKDTTAPVSKLEELSRHPSSAVRSAVAGNLSTPVETLAALMQDETQVVRYGVAKNPTIGVEVVRNLASSSDDSTRLGLAQNSISDVGVLTVLLKDENIEVRTQALIGLGEMDDNEFTEGLLEAGFTDLVHMPRRWALKALGANF